MHSRLALARSVPYLSLSFFMTGWLQAAFAETATDPTASIPVITVTKSAGNEPVDSVMPALETQSTLGGIDTAAMLSTIPGVASAAGGGFSSLPILRGMADDRNVLTVDGMAITSSCPNHMNPALSYVSPGNLGTANVSSTSISVADGGDSIGGSIAVAPAAPVYADGDEKLAIHGALTTAYRSNGDQFTTNGNVSFSGTRASIGYDGSWSHGNNRRDGNGDAILASSFLNQSHNGSLALGFDKSELVFRGGYSYSPYQGFPNQYMDMTKNTGMYANGGYKGHFSWGKLDVKAYWQQVLHNMNFLSDRSAGMPMPMNTEGTDVGYAAQAVLPLTAQDTLRLGNEFRLYRLDDWWPAVPGGYPAMGDNTFWSINGGSRNVFSTYAELERRWSTALVSKLGVRNTVVWMDSGNVQGYSDCNSGGMMGGCSAAPGSLNYALDAARFNAREHARTDVTFDVTASLLYAPSPSYDGEIGFARKSRVPNLYERYAWSTGNMAASMINWFGNGAEYVGNLDLKPETANTVTIRTGWHDTQRTDWDVTLTAYYSYIEDYIDVDSLGKNGAMTPGIYLLQFANHDAQMVGFDISGKKALMRSTRYGDVDLAATFGLTHGWRVDDGTTLYRMQPFNATLALNHRLGDFSQTLELRGNAGKHETAPFQNEQRTPGFGVLNWHATYDWNGLTFAAGVNNILDQQYYDPNGGAYVSGWSAKGMAYGSNNGMEPLPASGRSFNVGLTYKF
ncbi:MAG: TonB-dependent receptor plug domain-containing protein [Alphaproteobacteria bacterium]|nr:TonB-dependent receptor plug domain-containing protein [Alphaproteobacteria bacterium]